MTTISLKSVTKAYGALSVLKSIDLEVPDGEFLVLLGPSGCGKTTTMRIIAGLETATSGTVLKDGEDITNYLPRNRNMAMVFQNYALYPHMTVLNNIIYPLRMRGLSKAEREKRAREAADKVDLGPYLDRLPKNLSGGQRQRVALARALVREPDVFLMDEPLSNLDAKLRVAMRAEIKHLQRETGITTIYVTHDQIEAMTLADRVIIMEAGEIRQIGTPDEIYDDPENLFVAGFLGSPPMNFLEGSLKQGRFEFGLSSVAAEGFPDESGAQLGIRAEDIQVVENAKADLVGKVYSVEPTGEATLIAVNYQGSMVMVKADKATRPEINSEIGLKLAAMGMRYFRTSDGLRVKPAS
jgi:multiple sugar transport system ATP-binding protein